MSSVGTSRTVRQPSRAPLLGLFIAFSLAAAAAPAQSATLAGKAAISFTGSSTLHDFDGKVDPVVFTPDDASGQWSALVEVPVASMKTGNGWRDENMRGMLQADRYPSIRAVFAGIETDALRSQPTLTFALTIRDATHPVTAVLRHWVESAEHLEFDAEFSVSLKEYGLEAPRALFVRVDDKVTVTVHVTLDRT
jgi:polyisoprenoid-binding protein YceI